MEAADLIFPEFKDGDGGGEGGYGESIVVIRQVDNGFIINQEDESGAYTFVYMDSMQLLEYLKSYYVGV
jgi:hypothetical protein